MPWPGLDHISDHLCPDMPQNRFGSEELSGVVIGDAYG